MVVHFAPDNVLVGGECRIRIRADDDIIRYTGIVIAMSLSGPFHLNL